MSVGHSAFVRTHNSKPEPSVVPRDRLLPKREAQFVELANELKNARLRTEMDAKIIHGLRDEVGRLTRKLSAFGAGVTERALKELPSEIILGVAAAHGFSAGELLGPRRDAKLVRARHELAYRIHMAFPSWSFPRIAREMGYKDHTSVIHAVCAHAARMEAEKAGRQ